MALKVGMKSFRDLVVECDNFPYYESNTEEFIKLISSYYNFYLSNGEDRSGPHGCLPEWVVEKMPWGETWTVDHINRSVTPQADQNHVIRMTLEQARALRSFSLLDGWRSELYPIHGVRTDSGHIVSMERSASPLFGINTYGVHLTIYTNTHEGMKIWVPRRACSKQTYPGMLDNTVAGGLSTAEKPLECLIREAMEEASLSEQLVRSNVKPVGTVSYVHIRDSQAGGETGLLQPECQYVYDMEVGPGIKPKPNDKEVEDFYLWTVNEVKEHLAMGEFKPNCAAVLIDFFVRHGILTAENEPQYAEIVSRLHRRLPFPTS